MTERGYALLRGVSRSFYISIRALPRVLREPVALGYLLARTSDTIADTQAVELNRRIELLDQFAAAINGAAPESEVATAVSQSIRAGSATNEEQTLLASTEVFLRELATSDAADRADIRMLLATIIRGQRLDLLRWNGGMAALRNGAKLREYTYLVAGCVGEFWTRLCFRKLPGFATADTAEMMKLGRGYGCGLQLVNVLRDAGEDLRAGRCYFPEDELRSAGLTPEQIEKYPEKFLPVYHRWVGEARNGLDAGLEYCIAINPPRVRLATVLPALIGIRTLELLKNAGVTALTQRVKVPRAEVRKMIASTAITLANRTRLRSMRARL